MPSGCRSESFTHMRSLPLKRKIDDLEVYCPNKADGCELIIRIGWLKNHTENECGFARILCTQGCGKLSLRKDLTQHCSNECMKRKMNIVARKITLRLLQAYTPQFVKIIR